MNFFEEELAKGNLVISTCPKCELAVWPPSEICSRCFGMAGWKKCSGVGKILEFSRKDGSYFCLAEFEKGVRVMGALTCTESPKISQKVRLVKSELRDGQYCFEMRTVDA